MPDSLHTGDWIAEARRVQNAYRASHELARGASAQQRAIPTQHVATLIETINLRLDACLTTAEAMPATQCAGAASNRTNDRLSKIAQLLPDAERHTDRRI